MSKRTFIIFILFLVVAMVTSVFIFYYRQGADRLLKEYSKQIAVCSAITSEDQCFENEYCEGIYIPSCPDCKEIKFNKCQRIPLTSLLQERQDQALCEETGGVWHENKLGDICVCDRNNPNIGFDSESGCTNNSQSL